MTILQIMLTILLILTFTLMFSTSIYALYCEFKTRKVNKDIVKIIITAMIVLSIIALILAIVQI